MMVVVLKVTLLLMVAAAAAFTDAHDLNMFNRKFMLTNSEEKSVAIPYNDCINSCESCACTLIYPPELSRCICLDYTQEDEEDQEISGVIPYKECMQSCETCACTLDYPPGLSKCICLNNLTTQNSDTLLVDAKLSSGNKRHLIPYPECIQSCKECACTKMWPPQLSQCVCLSNSFP